jgi:hypothetical protein
MPLADITNEQFIDAIKAVASESPETVYTPPAHMNTESGRCFYVHTDAENPEDLGKATPGCLIGVALHRVGVPLYVLQEHEGDCASGVISRVLPGASTDTLSFANIAQGSQDEGKPWGMALSEAENYKGE